MSHRLACFALLAGLVVSGCSSSTSPSTTPAAAPPKFTAALSPANEVPAVSNADATGSGTATITMTVFKDAAGNITTATVDFAVSLTGFPAGTTLTGAHIHPGAAGINGGIIVNTGLTNGEITLPGGAGSITKGSITVDPALAQAIINAPGAYYFNVHSTLNTGGAARGQLVRAN
ncbi:MAG: CHRD domain-containing protein [Vicinamibacterales bacterium]